MTDGSDLERLCRLIDEAIGECQQGVKASAPEVDRTVRLARHLLDAGVSLPRGCYICQPDNPDADPEGCTPCEREAFGFPRRASG
jgi:hypothetical protein